MSKLSHFFKVCLAAGSIGLFASCGTGFDYNPSTSTLKFIPGKIVIGDLQKSASANELLAQADAYEAQGKPAKAFGIYKNIATKHPHSTQAPTAHFRIAQYYEADKKRQKAFDSYQHLISNYIGTPLYKPSLERQIAIAHKSAKGEHTNKLFFFNVKIPLETVDTMLTQVVSNAPYDKTAAESFYLRGVLRENEKQNTRAIALYRELTRTYPESAFSGEALFRIGNILHQQSLKGNTNLDNSRKAIETFDELITLYPSHPRSKDAKKLKTEFAGYDVQRSLEVAQFYEQKQEYTSAVFYYNEVLKATPSHSDVYKNAKAKITSLTTPQTP